MQTWNHLTFTELFKHSPQEAFEYRFKTTGAAIPEEFATPAEVKKEEEIPLMKITESEVTTMSDQEMIDQIKKKLLDAKIPFHQRSGLPKLIELAKTNNLL